MNDIFKEINDINDVQIKYDSIGRFGFVVADSDSFYLPVSDSPRINHPEILKFTIRKLYGIDTDVIKKLERKEYPSEIRDLFTDGTTFNLASFIASNGNIVFINTGDKSGDEEYYSGILFLPYVDALSDYQKETLIKFNKIFPLNNDDNSLVIATVNGEMKNGVYKTEEIDRNNLEGSLLNDREKRLH